MSELNAVATLRRRAPTCHPRVAVVLGSGWGALTDHVHEPLCIPYSELDGFPHAGVAGHSGMLWLGRMGATPVAVMSGRRHSYESGAVDGMRVPLRVLQALGCTVLVQTNAAGSLRAGMPAHSLMLLRDHINLPQRSPLVGEAGSQRFVSMEHAYDPGLCALAHECAHERGLKLHEGVYAWAFGPQFETPAEIRMLRLLGADAVGMSTVPETILARHAGMRVLALSLITNMGAGLSDEQLSHANTLAQAQSVSSVASGLLADIVGRIDDTV